MNVHSWIQERTELIDNELERQTQAFSNEFENLRQAVVYSLMGRGKKFRPLLMLASGETLGLSPGSLAPFFTAVECIHCYSLVHDDLPAMDNDDFRRGKPTTHKVYGEDMAILAGDALLTWAFEIACVEESVFEALHRLRAVRLMAECAGWNGMAGGQSLDLLAEKREPDALLLENIHRNKTGRLIEASLCIPPVLNNSPAAVLDSFRRFSRLLGKFYQIQDDLLDVVGEEKKAGKKLNKDRDRNKLTWVAFYGLEKSRKTARELYEQAREILEDLPFSCEPLKGLLDAIESRKH